MRRIHKEMKNWNNYMEEMKWTTNALLLHTTMQIGLLNENFAYGSKTIIPGSLIKGWEKSSTAEVVNKLRRVPHYKGLHTGLLITNPSSPSLCNSTYGITAYSPKKSN
jgi:hypothetical protein